MNRRDFIKSSIAAGLLSHNGLGFTKIADNTIMTVKGPITAKNIGLTLAHEHVLVDFTGAADYDPTLWNQLEVVEALMPYLQELKSLGFDTFIEYTPAFLGRDPLILQQLSVKSGLNIITNTGYYGAVDDKYLPQIAFEASAEELARIWIDEYQQGIEGTGIKPGFIKISVNPTTLSELHGKLITAAAITHQKTGLTIASHTGPSVPAFEQLEVLKHHGVHPSAFIWVHAQNEKNTEDYLKAAKMGAWVSLDGIQESNIDQYTESLFLMKQNALLDKVLISQDAGWYEPGTPWNGPKRKYTDIYNHLIPRLKSKGFTRKNIRQLLEINPGLAYTISVRKT